MGRLILAGGGDSEQTLSIDKEFVNLINTDKPLLYIPIAMDTKFIPYESCFKWVNGVFNSFGIDNIIMWTENDLINKQIEDLNQFSAVYIGGGNTFSLLEHFNKALFTNVLKEYVENEGIIYGGSAGAIILGKDIGTCSHMDSNDVDLKELSGLGLVENYSIWCHYKIGDDTLISTYILEYKNPVISLPEETGLLLNEEGMKVIGEKPAFIFDGEIRKIIQPGHYC